MDHVDPTDALGLLREELIDHILPAMLERHPEVSEETLTEKVVEQVDEHVRRMREWGMNPDAFDDDEHNDLCNWIDRLLTVQERRAA